MENENENAPRGGGDPRYVFICARRNRAGDEDQAEGEQGRQCDGDNVAGKLRSVIEKKVRAYCRGTPAGDKAGRELGEACDRHRNRRMEKRSSGNDQLDRRMPELSSWAQLPRQRLGKADRGAPHFQQRSSVLPVRARRDQVSYYVEISANLSYSRMQHTNLEPV